MWFFFILIDEFKEELKDLKSSKEMLERRLKSESFLFLVGKCFSFEKNVCCLSLHCDKRQYYQFSCKNTSFLNEPYSDVKKYVSV